jgi:hypothetical protein
MNPPYSPKCFWKETSRKFGGAYRNEHTERLTRDRSYATMHDDESSRLPVGYSLDLMGDPCVIILRRPDRTIVARFTRNVDPEELRRTAEADSEGTPEE